MVGEVEEGDGNGAGEEEHGDADGDRRVFGRNEGNDARDTDDEDAELDVPGDPHAGTTWGRRSSRVARKASMAASLCTRVSSCSLNRASPKSATRARMGAS